MECRLIWRLILGSDLELHGTGVMESWTSKWNNDTNSNEHAPNQREILHQIQ